MTKNDKYESSNGNHNHNHTDLINNNSDDHNGNYDSDIVVLGFVTYQNGTDMPLKSLFDFDRVYVKQGQIVNVTLSMSPYEMSNVNQYGNRIIYNGYYQVNTMCDVDYDDTLKRNIVLTGDDYTMLDVNKIKQKYYDNM